MKPEVFFAKFEEIFADEDLPKKLCVAVSGGADSLALTLLLQEFCLDKNIEIFAVTIDHKMRADSAKEAAELGKILAERKISHSILTISATEVPTKNIEAELREMRYEMLIDFCEKNEIRHLFLGHHIGDIAENFLIRLFRGSGLDGLSAISEVSKRGQIKLVRPLLNFKKDDLKSFLRSKKVEWFEDESNLDEKFLRNKIRNFLATFDEKDLIEKRIKNAADEIAKTRDFFDEVMWHESKDAVVFGENEILINRQKFRELDQKIALKILALSLMKIGQKNYKPRREKLERFYQYLISQDELKPRHFYGCIAKKFDQENAVILPENE
jgi:tRNA(Ile)-lysidine synthase